MATYTKLFPGAPDSGKYAFGDVVIDNTNTVWTCVQAGLPGRWVGSSGDLPLTRVGTGASAHATVVAEERGVGNYHRTVLTLTNTPVAITEALSYGSLKLYDMPEGRLFILGVMASLALAVPAPQVRASTINDNATIDWALGTVAASNVALTGTMVDLLPLRDEAAFAASGNGYGAVVSGALAAAAQFDGTTTPVDVFANFGFSDVLDIDADSTINLLGTVQITWVQLGDL